MAEQPVALGPVDFSTHVLSLASTALISIGKMPAPDGQPFTVDLETGRHLIDVLGMLETKTKGNLAAEESEVLKRALTELRMNYVDELKKDAAAAAASGDGAAAAADATEAEN